MQRIMQLAAVMLLSTCLSSASLAARPAAAERDIQQALTRFLTAFENLDMPAFMACFADDATVFFPLPEPPDRFDGKPAIEQHFAQVFAALRAAAPGGPPFHELRPQDLRITLLGTNAAVVSFELRNSQRIARRTVVFTRVMNHWLIQHLHASNVPLRATAGIPLDAPAPGTAAMSE